MRLEEAKRLHPNEWIAFRPLGEGENPEGRLILHHPDRRTFDKKLIRQGISDVYITFTGPLVREGFSVMFCVTCDCPWAFHWWSRMSWSPGRKVRCGWI